MITQIKGKNGRTIRIEILCDEPCCERPPCSPLTMGKQIDNPFEIILIMISDPECWFNYSLKFNGLDEYFKVYKTGETMKCEYIRS